MPRMWIQKATTNSTVEELFVGDYGVEFVLDMGEDISGATGEALNVEKPDGSTSALGGSLTIYNNHYLKYVSADGDLNLAGVYRLQAAFTLAGFTGSFPIFEFRVSPKIAVT